MLFRNVLRTLQKRYLQLLLLGIIIVLSSFIYTTMDYALSGTLDPTEAYFETSNQEDYAISMLDYLVADDVSYIIDNCPTISALPQADWPFTVSGVKTIDKGCYDGLLNRRVTAITNQYSNIDIEVREYKDVYFTTNDKSYRFRVLKETERINTTYVVAGEKPGEDNEVAVAEIFAKNNDLAIGDPFEINGTIYQISGFVLFPDYSLTLLGTEFIIDNNTQTLALFTNDEFEEFSELTKSEIAGTIDSGYDDDWFDEEVIKDFRNHEELEFISSITLTINNMRSGAIYSEIEGGRGMSIFLSLLIASIALMIVAIMVSRVLHSQRGPIGILKSMGYTNGEIARPYLFFIVILSLPMILLGYYLGLKMARPFMLIYLEFYLLPSQPIAQTWQTIIVSIFIPFTFIVGLSYVIILRLLRQKPVTLLNPETTSETNKITKWIIKYFKKFKIVTKIQQLLLYRNLIKFVVFLVGMFFAAFLILFSFSMNNIFERMIYDYYDNTNHEYIAYCNYFGDCEVDENAEGVIEIPSVIINDEDASLVGLRPDSIIHPIYNERGDNITSELEEGVIISQSLSLTRGYRKGDELIIEIGEETRTLEVVGISAEYFGNKAYIEITSLSEAISDGPDYYNTVYSTTPLNSDDYLVVISVQDIINQSDSMNGFMNAFVYLMVIISIAIGGIIIYILTVMTIEDNFYNISLFKVIGYNNKEIDKMILGGYLLYGIIIFIISIPLAILSFWIMEIFFAQFYDLMFPLNFEWWHGVLSVIIFVVIFEIGAYSAKRKLSSIALQEAMKMYQV